MATIYEGFVIKRDQKETRNPDKSSSFTYNITRDAVNIVDVPVLFTIKDNKILNTRISPTWYDTKHQVYLMNEEKSESFINRLMNSSPEGK